MAQAGSANRGYVVHANRGYVVVEGSCALATYRALYLYLSVYVGVYVGR